MKPVKRLGFKARLVGFFIFIFLVSAWNMALSSRRKFFSGTLVKTSLQDVLLTVRSPGKIEPRVQETIRSLISGKNTKIYVNEGDAVKKGELLMEISGDEIGRELKQKENAHTNQSADMEKAQKDYALAKKLYSQGAIPRREVDDAKQTLVRAQQTVGLAVDELAAMRKKAEGVRVVSPISGTVLKINALNKDDISEKEELMKVALLDDLILRAQVDELEISKIKPGQEASIVCDAFPGVKMPATIFWIGAQAKEGAFADIDVIAEISDTQGLQLKPNLSCRAFIVTGSLPGAIVLPDDAVRRGPEGPYVLKAYRGGWLKRQPVEAVSVTSDSVAITSGLSAGETVLVPKRN